MAVHTTQAEFVIRLADEDRILLRQLIDRLANPVAPTLPWPGGVPGTQQPSWTPAPQQPSWTPAPQWWQNPVICETLTSTNAAEIKVTN